MKNQIIKIVRVLDFKVKEDRKYADKYLDGCLVHFSENRDTAADASYVKKLYEYDSFFGRHKVDGFIAEISIEPLIGKVFYNPDPILEQFEGKMVEIKDVSGNWFKVTYLRANNEAIPFFCCDSYKVPRNAKLLRIIPETLEESVLYVDHEFKEVDEAPTMIIDGYKWHKGEKA